MILAHPVPSIQNQSATLKEKVKSIIWCNQLGIAFGRIYRQGDWRIYVLVEISLDCNNSGKVDRRRIVADTRTDFDALRVIHESCASWRCVAMTRHKVSNRKLRATLIIMIAKFGSANKHENFYFSLGLMLCISNRFLCFYLAIENEGKYLWTRYSNLIRDKLSADRPNSSLSAKIQWNRIIVPYSALVVQNYYVGES